MSRDERPNDEVPDGTHGDSPRQGFPADPAGRDVPGGSASRASRDPRLAPEPGGKRSSGGWLRWFVPVTAAAAVVALTAGTATALRAEAPGSGDPARQVARQGAEPAGGGVSGYTGGTTAPSVVVDPARPTGRDAPVSEPGAPATLPTGPADLAEPTAAPAQPASPEPGPGGTRGSAPPWPGDGRPMTGTWAETGPDGQRLTLHFYGSPRTPKACAVRYTARALETPGKVLLRVHERRPRRGGGSSGGTAVACPDMATERTVTVELDHPLGGRGVYELPERREVPVRGR